jgi:hypothetical protein
MPFPSYSFFCRAIWPIARLPLTDQGLQRSLPKLGRRADLHRSATFSNVGTASHRPYNQRSSEERLKWHA